MRIHVIVRVKDKKNLKNLEKWGRINHVFALINCVSMDIGEFNMEDLAKEEGVLSVREAIAGQYWMTEEEQKIYLDRLKSLEIPSPLLDYQMNFIVKAVQDVKIQ